LVIIDNCTRKCIGLPLFIKGKHVSAVDVVKSLEKSLNQELNYIISDNGKQFVAKAFQKFCENNSFVHVRISPHRPATNGIAERFVRRLKEMLAERTWVSAEELSMILEEILEEYNDSPHQGINGLSPKEYERRLMCTV
jgi:transposase InsO family protein